MLEATFDGDGVESLFHFGNPAHDANRVLLANLTFNRGWRGEQAFSSLSEDLQDRAILEFMNDIRPYLVVVEPTLEFSAQRADSVDQQFRRPLFHRPNAQTSC